MKTFKVSVREEIYSSVYVNAEDAMSARDIAHGMYIEINHDGCVDQYEDIQAEVEDVDRIFPIDGITEISSKALNLLEK